ncbi:methyltransferase domain-containing protein [Taibaiella koreensis]|uniref:hypothetical protein n=1 Tax=Taibaiella koreensis TaxID=1268548 RepID=UPI000E59A304|nr:hypothetical protein [Taibaiella koreensis]
MIIQIKSRNEHLLDLLFKNPDTDFGLYFKPLKDGIIAGNVVSPHEYEIVFQDTQFSYMPEDGDQLDFQSYSSPLALLHICTELFSHILKDKETFLRQELKWLGVTQGSLDKHACHITVPTLYIHSGWYRDGQHLLSRYFPGLKFTQRQGRNFCLEIEGASVFEAFNLLSLVALLSHVTNEYGLFKYIDDSFAYKYVRVLTNIEQVPYFIFYLYAKRAVKSVKQFQLVKPVMEQYLLRNGIEAELTWYGTQQDRQLFITGLLDTGTAILDIGCGELSYYKRMMNKGLKATYYAVDEEERFAQLGAAIARRLEATNLEFYTRLEDCGTKEEVNIIMSEVIEHNTLEAAGDLIKKAMTYNFRQITITTPNADFNIFYGDDDRFRHEDHHFELSREAFRQLIDSCLDGREDARITFDQIGDKLNGLQPTQACIISRIPKNDQQ